MSRYIGRALGELNPCGIENKPETHCKYVAECRDLGSKTMGFVCISKIAYQLAGSLYNTGNNIKQEKKDLAEYLSQCLGKKMVDPKQKEWKISELNQDNLNQMVDLIAERGERMYQDACTIGSLKNPINFNYSNEDIVKDLF